MDAERRRKGLIDFYHEIEDCQKCSLAATRTTVVFGTGDADADLMFVGEAPGFHEDKQGKPFVGQAGKLLDKLLGEIGLSRAEVFIANVLKCRPPDNRDPQSDEIEACQSHLMKQIELIEPRVICTLGNFATKLLTANPQGITKVHGAPQSRALGGGSVFIYPLFHPAAALYTPAMLDTLRADLARVPALLREPLPAAGIDPQSDPPDAGPGDPPDADPGGQPEAVEAVDRRPVAAVGQTQLDLF